MAGRRIQPSLTGVVPWPPEAIDHYVAKGYWQGRSLGSYLVGRSAATPHAIAVVSGDTRLTYQELMARADGAALRLRDLGLMPDDRIVLQLGNRWEFIVVLLACLRAGVLPVMALPAHRKLEVSHLVQHSAARAIAVPESTADHDYPAMARAIADETDTVEHIISAGNTLPGSVDLAGLCQPADDPEDARRRLDADAPDSRSVALFLLSGGTTGMPKLIARTHDDYAYNARRSAELCRLDASTVYLAVLPLPHNFPLACPGILGTLLAGGRVVIAPTPRPEKVLGLIERERVTATAVVPAIAQTWMAYRRTHPEHDLGSLQMLQVGGARLADHIAGQISPTFGCQLQQAFGMAEGLLCFTRLDDNDDVICHTQGRPISPDDEVLVVDERGRPVPPGEPGLLLTRGPYTPRGYYRAERQNAEAFTADGWYRTGDIVRQRPDGNLIVDGRDKDQINRGGEKISAEEVENFAYQVDGVSMAAAVAMPDPRLGERVCLYVVPHPAATVCLDDIRSLMENAGVARFKLPERLVLADSLPRTNVGKIDKKALRADIEQRLG